MSQKEILPEVGEKLEEAILREKAKGKSDIEIGRKFGLPYRTLERIITRTKGVNVSSFKEHKNIKRLYPKDFSLENTTIWSFKQRGDWATHSGEYRGNWSPYIPRNVILRYSKPGELVLDYFCGAGTTAVECKLLGRKCIGIDINEKAIELAKKNVNFSIVSEELPLFNEFDKIYEPELIVGDARDLSFISDNSVDLICSHPPYANIIHYTDGKEGDLSYFKVEEFLKEMEKVAEESYRVLKPGRQCAILIGDTRKKKYVVPLGFKLIDVFLKVGFSLRELVIKRQHNCKTTGFWYDNSVKYNFLLLAHEYLPIFEKPLSTPHHIKKVKNKKSSIGLVPIAELCEFSHRDCRLETTSVWILPRGNFENKLLENLIGRYSGTKNYIRVSFLPSNEPTLPLLRVSERDKDKKLIYIKFPEFFTDTQPERIGYFIKEFGKPLEKLFHRLRKGSFIAIHTKDLRIDDCIFPSGMKVIEAFNYENLNLKEIIVVSKDTHDSNYEPSCNYLKIVHSYLLVYEVV